MKIFSAIFCAALLLSSQSYALDFFVGFDALHASAGHEAVNSSSASGPKNGDVKDSDKVNFGLNTGVRVDFLNLYASGELFFDNLNTTTKSFDLNSGASNSGNEINLDNRYGAKANAGFAIFPRVTPFLTYGLAGVNYKSSTSTYAISNSELTPLYGAGILVDLPLGVSLKASYDYQSFNMRYAESGSKIKTHLGVAKLGLIYNF
ncbi:MAG: outer membrane beta-barrel protein [Rickettsiales bacterium]|nr:outer membrane beta-barrel protein [Rickettsiales bacterium]